MENNNTENKVSTSSFAATIDMQAVYEVVDCHTGLVVRSGTHANRKRLRNWADRKDAEYGAVRFICRLSK